MKMYQFESMIEENGTIVVPQEIKALKHHRVRRILVDLDTLQQNPVKLLQDITREYTQIVDEAVLLYVEPLHPR
jgi:hypothetical protein